MIFFYFQCSHEGNYSRYDNATGGTRPDSSMGKCKFFQVKFQLSNLLYILLLNKTYFS